MNCEKVQPNLLDYSKKLLTGPEYEQIEAHLRQCPDCARVLCEEVALFKRLESLPDEQPANDVWALVRSRTRPKSVRPLVWLHGLVATNVRKAAAASVALTVLAVGFYNMTLVTPQAPAISSRPPVVAVYSDDPLGGHTDAIIDSIDDM